MKNQSKKVTPKKDWHDKFLYELRHVPNVTRACAAAGVSRKTAYEHRKEFAGFAQAWQDALDESVERLEYEMHRRAYEGIDHPVIYQGEITDTYKSYSDTLAIFLAKAHRPEKYRERSEIVSDTTLNIRVIRDE